MAKTQNTTTPLASGSVAANTDAGTTAIDVTTKAGAMFRVKVTCGATAPTVAPTFRALSSTDNTNFDADVNGGRYYEKVSFPIPANNATAYYDVPVDVTFVSYIKPIVRNEDSSQALTMEIVCVTSAF